MSGGFFRFNALPGRRAGDSENGDFRIEGGAALARTNAQIGRRELLRLQRQRVLATLLVLLAGLMLPLGAHMLADYSQAAALILPSLVLTAAIAVICPQWIIPPIAVAGMYAVGLITRDFQRQRVEPNVLERLLDGHLHLLWIPLAAVVMGWLLVYGRRRWWPRVLRPGFRTNLPILGRRPGVFARKYWLAITAVVVAAVLDMLSTIGFMFEYGSQSELHLPMRAMAEIFGIVRGLVLGTLGRLLFVMIVAAIWRRACAAIMLVCAVIYLLAAMCNHFRWLGPAGG